MKFEVVRLGYLPDRTLGEFLIDGIHFCWFLEDLVRPPGAKVFGETAIPEGTYTMTIEPFREDKTKMYPHLWNVNMFTGICIHGGNGPEDTEGCILVGYNKDDSHIYGSAIRDLTTKMLLAPKPWQIIVRMEDKMKKLLFVGFFNMELQMLIEHLKNTQYNEAEIKHLEDILGKERE